MAYIPVEKKKRHFPWWLLLLLLLLPAALALILWGLYDEYQEEPEPVAYETTVMEGDLDEVEEPSEIGEEMPGQEPGGQVTITDIQGPDPITDVQSLTQAADLAALAGRQIQLENMRVTEVVGDGSFIVQPDGQQTDRKFFVLLREQPTPGLETEGRYDVTQGQVVTIHGEIQAFDAENPTENLAGVSEDELQPVKEDKVILLARRLDVTERP